VSLHHRACSRMPSWSSPQHVTSTAQGLQAPKTPLHPNPPYKYLRDCPMRTSTCRCGVRLFIIPSAHEYLHGARLRMSSRSRKVFRLPRLLLSTPTPTSHTQYLGTLFENIYLSGRKEECVLSSSRLLTDASLELASRCHSLSRKVFRLPRLLSTPTPSSYAQYLRDSPR
jgi:hypothetical protein